jgi:hypothetical protein
MSARCGMAYQTVTLILKLMRLPKSNCIIFKMDAVRFCETSAGSTCCQNPEDYHLSITRSKNPERIYIQ